MENWKYDTFYDTSMILFCKTKEKYHSMYILGQQEVIPQKVSQNDTLILFLKKTFHASA